MVGTMTGDELRECTAETGTVWTYDIVMLWSEGGSIKVKVGRRRDTSQVMVSREGAECQSGLYFKTASQASTSKLPVRQTS